MRPIRGVVIGKSGRTLKIRTESGTTISWANNTLELGDEVEIGYNFATMKMSSIWKKDSIVIEEPKCGKLKKGVTVEVEKTAEIDYMIEFGFRGCLGPGGEGFGF